MRSRQALSRRAAFSALALLFSAGVGQAAFAAPQVGLLYERTLMLRADARCRVFTPAITTALAAAAAQARGAALRAGVSSFQVGAAEVRAQAKADATACGSTDLKVAATRVRQAFVGYTQLSSMTFPGGYADWRAVRRRSPPGHAAPPAGPPHWSLVQFSPAGVRPTLVGLQAVGAGAALELSVVDGAPGAITASAARLVMRDPAKAPQPYLDGRRRSLLGQIPPRELDRVILARSKGEAPPTLLPSENPHGVLFQFPAKAVDALAALDPREAAAVEFVFPAAGGERIATAWIEAGDLAAARAFIAAGQ